MSPLRAAQWLSTYVLFAGCREGGKIIDAWLDGDRDVHRKQRHAAKRVYERLRDVEPWSRHWSEVRGEGLHRRLHDHQGLHAQAGAPRAGDVRRWRQADVLRGQSEAIGNRLARDLAAMSDLPATAFDACDQATGRVSSQALVRYKTNDYTVPVAYGRR